MRKLESKKSIKALFLLCWFVYFTTYLGRLNYSASLAEMVNLGEFTKGQAGFIGTVFFATYGIGQFVNGFLGDKLSAKWMIFTGLFASSIANFFMFGFSNPTHMAIIWGINGFVQSLIWSPIIRTFSDYLPANIQKDACVKVNSSVPIGTFVAYFLTAGVIYAFDWRASFFIPACILMVVSFTWLFCMTKLEKDVKSEDTNRVLVKEELKAQDIPSKPERRTSQELSKDSTWSLVLHSGAIFFCVALCMQGILKDGVTTWIPTYIIEQFNISPVVSIISTTIIPMFNLLGVFIAGIVNKKIFKNEIKTACAFFMVSLFTLLLLRCFSNVHFILSLLFFGVATTAMMAVNTMLVSVLPMYFGKYNKSATMSGILNSFAYLGSAISVFGIGELSILVGWDKTIEIWGLCAIVGIIVCLFSKSVWTSFLNKSDCNMR